jgi:hypothetical protein
MRCAITFEGHIALPCGVGAASSRLVRLYDLTAGCA